MAMRYWQPSLFLVAGAGLTGLACFSPASDAPAAGGVDAAVDAGPCTQLDLPNGGPVRVSGTVVEALADGGNGAPLRGAMVSAEYGGLYLAWCDMSRASPYYLFGAVTDDNGHFEMDARAGFLGFHSFASGYYYSRGSLDTGDAGSLVLRMDPLQPGTARPTVSGAGFDNATVGAGKPVTFSATVTAAKKTDPLSDELLLVEPTRSWSRELDPPGRGSKDDFPDGLWKATFPAPDKPGNYTYYFSTTTAHCVSSDVTIFTLTVQ